MDDRITEILNLIDELDNFGQLDRKLPIFSIAVGTLRKDRQLAADIITISQTESGGMGALALSRILVEDLFYVSYLVSDIEEVDINLDLFNTHPFIDNYVSMQAMRTWGYEFNSEESKIVHAIEAGFEKHKDKFIRHGKKHDPFKADNYFRTWTKMNLESVIAKAKLGDDDASSNHFLNESYNTASTIIHHNAFNVWFLATQGVRPELLERGYNEIATRVTFISLNRLVNLVINLYSDQDNHKDRALEHLLKLETIMDKFLEISKK